MMAELTPRELLARIDLVLLAAQARGSDVEKIGTEAHEQGLHGICVNGAWVELARAILDELESPVRVVALIGFPLGAADADAKRYEAEIAVDQGAHELEFVINAGRLKDGDRKYVLREMRDLVEATSEHPVTAVLESHLLTREETILACELALDSGVKAVMTGSGFYNAEPTAAEVKLLRETVGKELGVKAGGIHDPRKALALIEAGATRMGRLAKLAVA